MERDISIVGWLLTIWRHVDGIMGEYEYVLRGAWGGGLFSANSKIARHHVHLATRLSTPSTWIVNYKSRSAISIPQLRMEEDRALVDVGKAVDAELETQKPTETQQPKKRFIGRRAAAEIAQKKGDSNNTIEDSGAITGLSMPIFTLGLC